MDANQKEQLLAAFKQADRDQSGWLSRDEIKTAMKQIYSSIELRLSDADIDHLIKSVDKDGNDKVSYEEFTNLL